MMEIEVVFDKRPAGFANVQVADGALRGVAVADLSPTFTAQANGQTVVVINRRGARIFMAVSPEDTRPH